MLPILCTVREKETFCFLVQALLRGLAQGKHLQATMKEDVTLGYLRADKGSCRSDNQ